MQSQDKIFLNEDAKVLFFIHIIPATFKWYFEYFLLHYFKRSTRCLFSKNKKWSVSPVSFHGKLERNIALTRTVKDREFKCFFCDEEEEVIILRKKAFILKNLIRHNFNFISQLVTSNKVKIADMIWKRFFLFFFFANSEDWMWFFTYCHFSFKNQWFCFFICCHCFRKQRMFFPCLVTIPFIRKGCALLNCHCSLNKQWRHSQCSY